MSEYTTWIILFLFQIFFCKFLCKNAKNQDWTLSSWRYKRCILRSAVGRSRGLGLGHLRTKRRHRNARQGSTFFHMCQCPHSCSRASGLLLTPPSAMSCEPAVCWRMIASSLPNWVPAADHIHRLLRAAARPAAEERHSPSTPDRIDVVNKAAALKNLISYFRCGCNTQKPYMLFICKT